MGAVAGEEQVHTLDQLLGNPISRTNLYIHKSLALIADCIPPTLAVAAAILLGAVIMRSFRCPCPAFCRCHSVCCFCHTRMGFVGPRSRWRDRQQESRHRRSCSRNRAISYLVNILVPAQSNGLSFTRNTYLGPALLHRRQAVHTTGSLPGTHWSSSPSPQYPSQSGLYRFNRRDLR